MQSKLEENDSGADICQRHIALVKLIEYYQQENHILQRQVSDFLQGRGYRLYLRNGEEVDNA